MPTCWCRTSRRARRRGWVFVTKRCSEKYPRLIVCDISGYGADGPVPRQESLRPADPERVRFPVDHRDAGRSRPRRAVPSRILPQACTPTRTSSPRFCNAARPGADADIDVSMLESMVEWMSYPLYYAFDGPTAARAVGRRARDDLSLWPLPRRRRQDGHAGLQNEREWALFCEQVLLQPELATDDALHVQLEAACGARSIACIDRRRPSPG